MGKKIADKGASEAFIRAHAGHEGDACIEWPFCKNDRGYGLAVIGGVQRAASRWMCVIAHGDPTPPRDQAAHSCGNPGCVNPKHLRWATHLENMKDRWIHGTTPRGERSGRTRLTEDDVRAIRAAPPLLKPLMEKYGLSKHGVSKIRGGRRWAHIQ